MTIVLLSGGLDSAVLLAQEARAGAVLPVYVSVGLAWEAAEQRMLPPPASPPFARNVAPLETLDVHDARRVRAVALGDRRQAAGVRHAR